MTGTLQSLRAKRGNPWAVTVNLVASGLKVPPPFMDCEDQDLAELLGTLHKISSKAQKHKVGALIAQMADA